MKRAQTVIRDQELVTNDPKNRIFKRIVEEGLQVLQDDDTPSPFKRRKGAELMSGVYDQLNTSGADRSSTEFHEQASCLFLEDEVSETGKKIVSVAAQAMEKSPYMIVNTSHIRNLDKTGGYHLHMPDSSARIEIIATNPVTHIRFALIDGKKLSTLFPEGTTPQDIVLMVNQSRKIAREENRTLRMTSHGYLIECYNRGPILNVSSFPVFLYAEFGSAEKYDLVEGCSVSLGDVVNAACDPRAKIVYRNVSKNHVESLILDLAPVFQTQTKVSKGMLFKFDRASIPESLGQIFTKADESIQDGDAL